MKMSGGWLAATLFLVVSCTFVKGDSVILRDGRHIRGSFSGGTQGVIAFAVGGTTQYYDVRNVLAMTFGDEAENPANPEPEQVMPILPNGSYLRPNRAVPHKSAAPKVTDAKYKGRKSKTDVAAQTVAQ